MHDMEVRRRSWLRCKVRLTGWSESYPINIYLKGYDEEKKAL